MKSNRTSIFIVISSIALLIVLIIQVNWIFQTAKIKEEIFNEKADMVISKTAEVLSSDTATCKQMEQCIGKDEIHKTDSLLTNYMKFYDLHLNYSFEVKNPNSSSANTTGNNNNRNNSGLANNVYKKRLEEEATKNGLELNLFLPEKKQFIVEEMGTMFITSVILILVVLIMFWRTLMLLMREKRISEHTTDFLNNMTHEFKTPLTNIALAGKMMIKDSTIRQEDKIKHYSGIILEENEKLRLQVEQVLSMTALERGEIPLLKTETNLHELIKDSLKCISIQIENKHGNVTLDLGAERVVINGDKTHLTNAFCNLIDNAIKYSRQTPELTIRTFNIDKNIVVEFSDKGIGIEKGNQKKVFDKFFRVHTGDVHDVKGFGLGLAYIKKIVELHDGTIGVQSEKERELHLLLHYRMSKEKHQILLAEDDLNLGVLLVDYLETEGFNVKLCKDGELALKAYQSSQFDLCIFDVMMPKMDGFTLAKSIRTTDKRIPIIFITAKSMKEDKLKGYDLGADDYITKPFDEEELLWKIKAVIRRIPGNKSDVKTEITTIGKYIFDFDNQSLNIDGQIRRITERESDVLKYISDRRNKVIKREELLKEVWGENDYFFGRSLDVFITKIRKYLKEDPDLNIENVFGVGFIFNVPS